MGARGQAGRTDADRQVEERLALLLRPGPRRAWLTGDDLGATPEPGPPAPATRPDHPDVQDQLDQLDDEDQTGRQDRLGDTLVGDRALDLVDPQPGPAAAAQLRRVASAGRPATAAGAAKRIRDSVPLLRDFGRPQLMVIVVLVAAGLLFGGWAVLRARPVAIASPSVATSASTDGRATAGTSTSQPTSTAGARATADASTTADGSAAAAPAGHDPPSPGAPSSAGSPTAAPAIKVHVLGAVHKPGVVGLPLGARVQDALDAAGGPKRSADLGDLNLAQPLADGQQLYIAKDGGVSEVRNPTAGVAPAPAGSTGTAPGGSPGTGSGSGSTEQDGGTGASGGTGTGQPVNLNTATAEELEELPGVGPVTASKIIGWRDQNGHFSSVEELQEVDGIGPKTYAELAPLVTV